MVGDGSNRRFMTGVQRKQHMYSFSYCHMQDNGGGGGDIKLRWAWGLCHETINLNHDSTFTFITTNSSRDDGWGGSSGSSASVYTSYAERASNPILLRSFTFYYYFYILLFVENKLRIFLP